VIRRPAQQGELAGTDHKMNLVFGPVPSRRLGQSLGIDPIPLKTCNWNCVYCQLGRSMPLVNERRDYVPPETVLTEVQATLAAHRPGDIDWITFVGSGEPTLHTSLGWMIRQVKTLTELPVAVITNGSLLYLPKVRQELSAADAVLPTLDAGDARLYRKINRPWPRMTFERLLDGLAAFRQVYHGKLWIEVMLVKGLNDTEDALHGIATALQSIEPDQVHIVLPTRPPVEPWVEPSDEAGLMRAVAILGNVAQIVHPTEGDFDLSGHNTVAEAIVSIITRHPMREDELMRVLEQWAPGRAEETLQALIASGQAQRVERHGAHFWSAAASHYPQCAGSRSSMPQGLGRKGEERHVSHSHS
jgi:wyosine [tRNA(Phe)-imidazoG37] synthetase (radical SAM superfamily)